MKIRKNAASGNDKVDINMTPMIDVVFQLLAFFIMSFKIVTQEGDFNVKMPLAAREGPADDFSPPMKVRMTADASGNLSNISMADREFGLSFDALHQFIAGQVGFEEGPNRENAEVELDCDYNLKYENVVKAITAVSGKRQGDQIIKLVEKIKFSTPRPKPGA